MTKCTIPCLFAAVILTFISAAAAEPVVTWDPLGPVRAEADTLFLPDLTSAETVEKGGGVALGVWQEGKPGPEVYDFGPGRDGPAFRGKMGAYTFMNWACDGLIPGDEFTIEFSFRMDKPWAEHFPSKPFFSLSGGNRLEVSAHKTALYVAVSAEHRPGGGRLNLPFDQWSLDDQKWHTLGFTLKDGALTVWLDGKKAGEFKDLPWGPLWSDNTHATGILLGSGPGGLKTWPWVSDLRISRTARVPGQVVTLRPLAGKLAVDAGKAIGAVPPHLLGALHQVPEAFSPGTVRQGLQVIRTDKFLTATPMKFGEPDAAHPTKGHSGRFSYDWRVVDRSLDALKDLGVLPFISIDSTPQILGGGTAPYSGDLLKNPVAYSSWSGFTGEAPNNLDDWSAVVGDFVHHVLKVRKDIVPWWGVWNEPAGNGVFWRAGLAEYLDLYAATVKAVRAVDPQARVGGPEVASPWDSDRKDGNWIKGLIERCAKDKLPLDFVSYHDYDGSLLTSDAVKGKVAEWSKAAGLAQPPPLVIGEFNWVGGNVYGTGKPQYRNGMWHLRAFNAAYTTAFLTRLLDLGDFELLIFSHTAYGDPRSGGWAATQLLGPKGERWAPFNAFVGWKTVMGSELLATQKQDLPPGVFATASRDPKTNRVGLVLSNYGFSQHQSRKVSITVTGLGAGEQRLTRWLVDATHSSRWDVAEDRPEGAAHDGLAEVEQQPLKVENGNAAIELDLPANSATFIAIDPRN